MRAFFVSSKFPLGIRASGSLLGRLPNLNLPLPPGGSPPLLRGPSHESDYSKTGIDPFDPTIALKLGTVKINTVEPRLNGKLTQVKTV
jgi:hypothetical protein